jgi:hypothetical protein
MKIPFWLSHIALARDVAAFGGRTLCWNVWSPRISRLSGGNAPRPRLAHRAIVAIRIGAIGSAAETTIWRQDMCYSLRRKSIPRRSSATDNLSPFS